MRKIVLSAEVKGLSYERMKKVGKGKQESWQLAVRGWQSS